MAVRYVLAYRHFQHQFCVNIAKSKEAYQHIGVSNVFANVSKFTNKL